MTKFDDWWYKKAPWAFVVWSTTITVAWILITGKWQVFGIVFMLSSIPVILINILLAGWHTRRG